VLGLLEREAAAKTVASDPVTMEMLWELIRAALEGMAQWWYEHQDVPRSQIVATTMNALWVGLERTSGGALWTIPTEARAPADP
jgi:hypothetical protein